MRTIEIPEANIKRIIPSNLGECNAIEYMDMCELILNYMCNIITYEEFRIHAVYKLMNMKPVDEDELDIKKKAANETKKHANIYQLSELIDDFFEINSEGQKVIVQNYIHNPVPSFKPLWKTYYGPSDNFMNVGFGEYCDAVRLMFQFNATGEVDLLYHIAAILYRPKKAFHFISKKLNNYNGDIRINYNSNTVEARADVFKKAPIGFVYGVYLLLASFQKIISSCEVPWAGKVLDFSILFTSSDNDVLVDVGKDDIGMDALMFQMAESGVFGSPKELNTTNIWLVLVRMYDTRLNDLKLKKQQEDATNQQI